jgi:hypothetical protein
MSLVWGKLHFILKILKSNHIMILYYNFWHSKENCFNISENIVLGNILSQNLYLKKHAYYFMSLIIREEIMKNLGGDCVLTPVVYCF